MSCDGRTSSGISTYESFRNAKEVVEKVPVSHSDVLAGNCHIFWKVSSTSHFTWEIAWRADFWEFLLDTPARGRATRFSKISQKSTLRWCYIVDCAASWLLRICTIHPVALTSDTIWMESRVLHCVCWGREGCMCVWKRVRKYVCACTKRARERERVRERERGRVSEKRLWKENKENQIKQNAKHLWHENRKHSWKEI